MRFAIVLVFVFALALAVTWYILSTAEPGAPPPPKRVKLAAGTPVPLVLLRQIEAGSTREGTIVPFMVAEDVKDAEGNVLIEKGSIAEGVVTWSRSEGSLSALLNQPARLAVELRRARAAGQEDVKLCADPSLEPGKPLQFTRENTGKPWERDELAKMAGDSAQREFMESLAASLSAYLASGDPKALRTDERAKLLLDSFLEQPGMEVARKYLDPSAPGAKRLDDLTSVYARIQDGAITKVTSAEVMLAVSALQELSRLAGAVDHALGRRLKGRTIKAYIGTPVKAYVAEDVYVRAKAR